MQQAVTAKRCHCQRANMLQNPCKTLGFKKNMVYKIPPGGEVNHIQPVAYKQTKAVVSSFKDE